MQFSRLTPLIASAVAALPPTAAYSNSVHISAPNLVPHGASQIIDHAFASFSFPAHWFADFTGNRSSPNLFSRDILDLLHKKSGARPYIRVGGTSADATVFNASQEISVQLANFTSNGIPTVVTIGPTWFEGFESFPGTPWNFQVNMWNSVDNAIEEARHALRHLGPNLVAFEIGNEPDVAVLVGEAPKTWNLQDYIAKWNTYADAISEQVLKGNPYGLDEWKLFQALTFAVHGNAFGLATNFTVPLAFEQGIDKTGHVKSVSQHQYAAGSDSWVRLQNSFMNHTAIFANLSQYEADMAYVKKHHPDITYLLGETNSDYINLNMAQIEGVFGSSLWLVDNLMAGMVQNISRMNFLQGTTFCDTAWVPVSYDGRDPYVRPPLYGHIVAADILGHSPEMQINEIELGVWNFSAYAVYDRKHLSKYVIVNLDEWNATTPYERPVQKICLTVPARSGIKTGIVSRLIGAGASADSGITWGGLSWNYTGGRLSQSGHPSREVLTFDKNGEATLLIPSTEMVVVTLLDE